MRCKVQKKFFKFPNPRYPRARAVVIPLREFLTIPFDYASKINILNNRMLIYNIQICFERQLYIGYAHVQYAHISFT